MDVLSNRNKKPRVDRRRAYTVDEAVSWATNQKPIEKGIIILQAILQRADKGFRRGKYLVQDNRADKRQSQGSKPGQPEAKALCLPTLHPTSLHG